MSVVEVFDAIENGSACVAHRAQSGFELFTLSATSAVHVFVGVFVAFHAHHWHAAAF